MFNNYANGSPKIRIREQQDTFRFRMNKVEKRDILFYTLKQIVQFPLRSGITLQYAQSGIFCNSAT